MSKIIEVILGWINWIKVKFNKKTEVVSEFPEGMIWLHPDVSGWAVTAKCTPSISGKIYHMEYTKKNDWPIAGKVDNGTVANCWMIFNINNQWYAATWEWLRRGQTIKVVKGNLGTYVKKSPVVPNTWNPQKGEKIGLFVSGLCRDKNRNISERSNVVWMEHP